MVLKVCTVNYDESYIDYNALACPYDRATSVRWRRYNMQVRDYNVE